MSYQYSININAFAVIENNWHIDYGIDLHDCAIFNMLSVFSNCDAVRKIIENGKVYFWFSWKLVGEKLPLIAIKTRSAVLDRYSKLIKAKLLEAHPENQKIQQSYFCFGENYSKMLFAGSLKEPIRPNDNLSAQTTTYPPTRTPPIRLDGHYLSVQTDTIINTSNNKVDNNEEMPEFSNSANTPTFLPKISTTNKKGKEEKSCAKKEETEDDKIISVPEIENTPTPENCNHGLFLLLRKFATNRKEKKAARYKFTKQAWKEMIKHFLEFSKRYSINVLELHLNESLNSVWISPFDSWAYDKLDRLQKSIGGEKPNSVQNIATKQQTGLFSEVCKKAYPNITTDTMSKIWVEIKAMMPKATDSELCEYAQKLFVQWGTAAMTPIKALSYPSRYFKINML